jgi:cytochrome c553
MTWPRAIPATALALAAVVVPVSAQEPVAVEVQRCASCHGRNGLPADRTVPSISGQQPAYTRKQLNRISHRNTSTSRLCWHSR